MCDPFQNKDLAVEFDYQELVLCRNALQSMKNFLAS